MYLAASNHLPENIANRKRFFDSLGFREQKIVVANLVHGTHAEQIDHSSETFILGTDALITNEKGIVLTLTGADCFPVYLEDSSAGIIGLAHCGWRGILGGIIGKSMEAIITMDGAPKNITLTIGPGICAKHFEIREDVLPHFAEWDDFILRNDGTLRVDLRGIIREQALRIGLARGSISDMDECTFCLPEKYFSYRRDAPTYIEAQVAYITQQD
jgi:YfiH family protein